MYKSGKRRSGSPRRRSRSPRRSDSDSDDDLNYLVQHGTGQLPLAPPRPTVLRIPEPPPATFQEFLKLRGNPKYDDPDDIVFDKLAYNHWVIRYNDWVNSQGLVPQCTYCLEGGHVKGACPSLRSKKDRICRFCGLIGHADMPEKCNKIKIGPKGEVGFCTWKECRKSKKQWGHYLVTCPLRGAEQGPYEFKEGENERLAVAPPRVMKKR